MDRSQTTQQRVLRQIVKVLFVGRGVGFHINVCTSYSTNYNEIIDALATQAVYVCVCSWVYFMFVRILACHYVDPSFAAGRKMFLFGILSMLIQFFQWTTKCSVFEILFMWGKTIIRRGRGKRGKSVWKNPVLHTEFSSKGGKWEVVGLATEGSAFIQRFLVRSAEAAAQCQKTVFPEICRWPKKMESSIRKSKKASCRFYGQSRDYVGSKIGEWEASAVPFLWVHLFQRTEKMFLSVILSMLIHLSQRIAKCLFCNPLGSRCVFIVVSGSSFVVFVRTGSPFSVLRFWHFRIYVRGVLRCTGWHWAFVSRLCRVCVVFRSNLFWAETSRFLM